MRLSLTENMPQHSPLVGSDRRQALGGFLVRQECWKVTLRGKFLVLALLVAGLLIVQRNAHSFLAVTSRVPAWVLIVDGWTPEYAIGQAAQEFREGHFHRVLVVRAVYGPADALYETDRHYRDYVANSLVQNGVPRESVETLFCPVVRKDRTFQSALAAKAWLAQQGISVDALDIATLGDHARRSRLLYEKAFGKGVKIGVIALDDQSYDTNHWWRSSEGLRETLGESIAYLYSRFFFHPSPTG